MQGRTNFPTHNYNPYGFFIYCGYPNVPFKFLPSSKISPGAGLCHYHTATMG